MLLPGLVGIRARSVRMAGLQLHVAEQETADTKRVHREAPRGTASPPGSPGLEPDREEFCV